MKSLKIENISNSSVEFINAFYKEVNGLDKKLVSLINSKGIKIILADKLSDINIYDTNYIKKYNDYNKNNTDKTIRGLCSDEINAICIFANALSDKTVGAILYHEIGHLIDCYEDWGKLGEPSLSKKQEFIEAYKKDIKTHWNKIKNDNSFRLKHYKQDSTPNKISELGIIETFAHCFARINYKYDDIDILGNYFPNRLTVAEKIYKEFFPNNL